MTFPLTVTQQSAAAVSMDTYQITIEPVVTKVQRHTWIVTYSDIFKFKYLNLHLYRIAHLGIVLALTTSSTFVMHLYEHEEKKFPKSGMFYSLFKKPIMLEMICTSLPPSNIIVVP